MRADERAMMLLLFVDRGGVEVSCDMEEETVLINGYLNRQTISSEQAASYYHPLPPKRATLIAWKMQKTFLSLFQC